MHDQVSELIWGLNDVKDEWDSNITRINEAIYQKAISIGMVKQNNFKFKEFGIQDMFIYHDGKMCLNCRRHLMCEKHSLLKKDKLIKEPDFERE